MSEQNRYPNKKPIYKRFWFWGIIILIYFFTLSNDDKEKALTLTNSPSATEASSKPDSQDNNAGQANDTLQSQTQTPKASYEEYANLPITNPLYLKYFESKHGIKLDIFPEGSEIEKFFSNLDEMMKQKRFLKSEPEFLSTNYYAATMEETDLIFAGELKNNRPHGIGLIGKVLNGYNNEPVLFMYYLGEFIDGRRTGYGVEFNVPDDNSIYSYLSNNRINSNDGLTEGLNYIVYNGQFKDGSYNGKGKLYSYSLTIISDPFFHLYDMGEKYAPGQFVDAMTENVLRIQIGTFKDGSVSGEFKQYHGSHILFEGNLNNKGMLYYPDSNQSIYDGEFKGAEFNGQGTLYEKSGNVIYMGKWDYGDYAN